jgi:DNA-binding transcriptional ArsR family regulator
MSDRQPPRNAACKETKGYPCLKIASPRNLAFAPMFATLERMIDHQFVAEDVAPISAPPPAINLPTRPPWPPGYGERQRKRILAVWQERSREALPTPTVCEIATAVGLSSSTVQYHIDALLSAESLVQHRAYGSRTILLPTGWWREDGRMEPCGECGRL